MLSRTGQAVLWFLLLNVRTSFLYASEPTGKEIVTKMINLLRGHSNFSHYRMEIVTPSWKRELELKVWDKRMEQKVFVQILFPAKDQGTSFLRIGYNLWMYMPKTERVMKIPPSLMLQPWMGSDFTNDDLVKESSYIEDYDHTVEATEKSGSEEVYRIRLDPKPKAPVVWGKVIFRVRTADTLPLRQSFYDEKGTLIKDLHFSEVKKLDGVLYPTVWKMERLSEPGHFTILTLQAVDFDPNPPISDSIFTEQRLRSPE